jgi:hypothetical protein
MCSISDVRDTLKTAAWELALGSGEEISLVLGAFQLRSSLPMLQTKFQRFEVLTAVKMTMLVFWILTPCIYLRVYRLTASIIKAMTLMMKAVSTSETSVNSKDYMVQHPRRRRPSSYSLS